MEINLLGVFRLLDLPANLTVAVEFAVKLEIARIEPYCRTNQSVCLNGKVLHAVVRSLTNITLKILAVHGNQLCGNIVARVAENDKALAIFLVYPRNDTCVVEVLALFVIGPYKKGGIIVDNMYCDPSTWNNHGSIAEFKGKWYVFYHRSSQNRQSCRRVCVEPIEFDENGMIKEVEQTSSGIEAALDVRQIIPARAACRMMANCCITISDGHEILRVEPRGHWHIPDWAEYKYLDFGDGEKREFCINVKGNGKITVKIDGDRELCTLSFDQEEYTTVCAVIPNTTGVHTLWLFFDGSFEVKEFWIQ